MIDLPTHHQTNTGSIDNSSAGGTSVRMLAWWTSAQVSGLIPKLIQQNIHVNMGPCFCSGFSARWPTCARSGCAQPSHFAGCENQIEWLMQSPCVVHQRLQQRGALVVIGVRLSKGSALQQLRQCVAPGLLGNARQLGHVLVHARDVMLHRLVGAGVCLVGKSLTMCVDPAPPESTV